MELPKKIAGLSIVPDPLNTDDKKFFIKVARIIVEAQEEIISLPKDLISEDFLKTASEKELRDVINRIEIVLFSDGELSFINRAHSTRITQEPEKTIILKGRTLDMYDFFGSETYLEDIEGTDYLKTTESDLFFCEKENFDDLQVYRVETTPTD